MLLHDQAKYGCHTYDYNMSMTHQIYVIAFYLSTFLHNILSGMLDLTAHLMKHTHSVYVLIKQLEFKQPQELNELLDI